MRYLGGKARQSKHIVAAIDGLHPNFDTYVEPFCGALWSACAVMEAFPGRKYILNDINPYLMTMWRAGMGGWDPPGHVTEADYEFYRKNKPADDPMTAYMGFAWSFGGKFFGGLARENASFEVFQSSHPQCPSTTKKMNMLRQNDVTLLCGDYQLVPIDHGSMIYLDPPYAGRTKQTSTNAAIDQGAYRIWSESLATESVVVATEFENSHRWQLMHDFGDTIVRHHSSKGKDGTRELLMRVVPRDGQMWQPPHDVRAAVGVVTTHNSQQFSLF